MTDLSDLHVTPYLKEAIERFTKRLDECLTVAQTDQGHDLLALGPEATQMHFSALEALEGVRHGDAQVVSAPSRMAFESVDSSNVHSIAYDAPRDILYVRFGDGDSGTYLYRSVPEKIWNGMYHADSHGSFLHNRIKGSYDYAQFDD